MASRYLQGKYTPLNPSKYIGDVNRCIFRSSWELAAFRFLDNTPEITYWNSEETVIKYLCPTDNKVHRYFLDILAIAKQPDGTYKKFLIEIKPESETRPPKKGRGAKAEETYIRAALTWTKNQAKWRYAQEYAKQKGFIFQIWTEKHLFPNQQPLKKPKMKKAQKRA